MKICEPAAGPQGTASKRPNPEITYCPVKPTPKQKTNRKPPATTESTTPRAGRAAPLARTGEIEPAEQPHANKNNAASAPTRPPPSRPGPEPRLAPAVKPKGPAQRRIQPTKTLAPQIRGLHPTMSVNRSQKRYMGSF